MDHSLLDVPWSPGQDDYTYFLGISKGQVPFYNKPYVWLYNYAPETNGIPEIH